MKMMKKIAAMSMMAVALVASTTTAFAAKDFSDVPRGYWASKEINAVVEDNIMQAYDDGTFKPEELVSRGDFVKMLLVTVGSDDMQVKIANPFTDISASGTKNYSDILRSEQLGLVYGYPDKTFKAARIMTKAEATSVLSHITTDTACDESILDKFSDKDTIPAWAAKSYPKAIKYDLYVNYPDEKELLPNKKLNRAETAVLLYNLKNQLDLVKSQYKNAGLGVEHLDVYDKAEVNTVTIMETGVVVDAKNVLKVYFVNDFKSKEHAAGDVVEFYAKEDVYTTEGTLVIPAGSKMIAKIQEIVPSEKMNKNVKVVPVFEKLILPCGKTVPFYAKPLKNDGVLTENRWVKPLAYTAGGGAIGAAVGTGFAAIPDPKKYGVGAAAIGLPVGAGVGLVTGLVTNGVNYSAKEGEAVLVELCKPLTVPNK